MVSFALNFNPAQLKGGTMSLNRELYRTADMLVEIAKTQGVFFAVALLYDSNYDQERIKKLLPILQKTKGAIKCIG
jgi:hypothetical protein